MLEYSKNYRKTTGRLWNYYIDEPNDPPLNPPFHNNPPTINLMQILLQILSLLNTKAVLQEKHQIQIERKVETLSRILERLREILKFLFH